MLRKIIFIIVTSIILGIVGYFTFLYYVTLSDGVRSGELIKISHKGMIFKTYEGELSQGISGAKIFTFSVMDEDKEAIQQLIDLQGQYVKVNYVERYKTFPWWGDTKYFVTHVEKEKSPHLNR